MRIPQTPEQHPPQAQATSKTTVEPAPRAPACGLRRAARGAAAARAGTWAGASLEQKLHEKLYPSLDEPSRGRLAPVRSVVRDCYAIVGGVEESLACEEGEV